MAKRAVGRIVYATGIQSFVFRRNEGLNKQGDYVKNREKHVESRNKVIFKLCILFFKQNCSYIKKIFSCTIHPVVYFLFSSAFYLNVLRSGEQPLEGL